MGDILHAVAVDDQQLETVLAMRTVHVRSPDPQHVDVHPGWPNPCQ